MNRARNNGRVGGVTDNGGMNLNGNMNGRMGNMYTQNGNNMNGQNGNYLNGQNGNNMNGQNGNNMNGQNDRMNDGRNIGGVNRGGALRGDLREQIKALSFVKVELELYLDTHPDCRTAIDYYLRTVEALKRLTEEYENTEGPLTCAGVVNSDRWTWVDSPWPWQRPGDYMQPREDR